MSTYDERSASIMRTLAVEAEPMRKPTVRTEPLALPSVEVLHVNPVRKLVEQVLAGVALLVLFPLLLVVGLIVRVTSPGPALYSQQRVGHGGVAFRIWKFRTMVDSADKQLAELLVKHNRNSEPLFKVPDDPRITAVGKFLRRSSIDELPQLLNVLRGEMSFIGPRPQRPQEVALYSRQEARRLAVPPGLTGLWQVSGRSTLSWHQSIELDLRYVDERSLWLDLRILLRTVVVVLTGRGAT